MKRCSVVAVFFVLVMGCEQGPQSPRGFSLPEGNSKEGQVVFVEKRCTDCHSVKDLALPASDQEKELNVVLGGDTPNVKTYTDLVTSIINPSHRILPKHRAIGTDDEGESKMRIYNDVLTVGELIDLVAFLQPQYQFMPYRHTRYPTYR